MKTGRRENRLSGGTREKVNRIVTDLHKNNVRMPVKAGGNDLFRAWLVVTGRRVA